MTGDRDVVTIVVDGRAARVASGASVAAALIDLGARGFRRSVRGEPRAPLCGMGSCFECRVTIGGIPHRRACLVTVADGMRVETSEGAENGGPGPGIESGAADRPVARNTTRAAVADAIAVDVAVVGAGPAGIAAAVGAAEVGRSVALLDSAPNAGGQIWRHRRGATAGGAATRWLERLVRSHVRRLTGTAVVDARREGAGPGSLIATAECDRAPVVVRAGSLVLATGARERFLPFPGWTLPGVVGVGGAQALLKQGASVAGKRVVIGGTGPLLLPVAAALSRSGARVLLVAEQAAGAAVRGFVRSLVRRPETLVQAALYRLAFLSTPYRTGTWVTTASGDVRLRRVTVMAGGSSRHIECDLLATGYGLVPNVELAVLLGCEVREGSVVVDEAQRTSVEGVYAAGEVTGVGGVDLALVEGQLAGLAAAGVLRAPSELARGRTRLREVAAMMAATFAPRPELRALAAPDTVVCRCEDVPRSALDALGSAREAKLHARAGMGTCQGRVCGPALDTLFGWPPDAVRPPVEPAALSTLITCGATTGAAPIDSSPGA